MTRLTQRNDTREHLLATGEQLILLRGFTGMGLSELLRVADTPKGSFYHYFRSKEAFGVALLERYFLQQQQTISAQLNDACGSPRQRLMNYFRHSLSSFEQSGHITGCLGVKVSAEVCDLSETMRNALNEGGEKITALYCRTLQEAEAAGEIRLSQGAEYTAQLIWLLWLGASLQSKISREAPPMRIALHAIECWLTD